MKATATGLMKQSCVVDGKRRNISIALVLILSGRLSSVVMHYVFAVYSRLLSLFVTISCTE